MTDYEVKDKFGRLVENQDRKFRPLDGEDISDSDREWFINQWKDLPSGQNKRMWAGLYHVMTGNSIQEDADKYGITISTSMEFPLLPEA